jgi:hypothetical protein
MATPLILPGYDAINGNKNSCLFKMYPECTTYTLDQPLEDQQIKIEDSTTTAVVHSYGFFIFMVGHQRGLFKEIKHLVVLDGYFPRDCTFMGESYKMTLPEQVNMLFFFPTVGDRSSYPLEAVVRQAMVTRNGIFVVRGIGFGHNLLYQEFQESQGKLLVQNCIDFIHKETCPPFPKDYAVVYPQTNLV